MTGLHELREGRPLLDSFFDTDSHAAAVAADEPWHVLSQLAGRGQATVTDGYVGVDCYSRLGRGEDHAGVRVFSRDEGA